MHNSVSRMFHVRHALLKNKRGSVTVLLCLGIEVIPLLLDGLVGLISCLGTSKASLSMKTTNLFTAL